MPHKNHSTVQLGSQYIKFLYYSKLFIIILYREKDKKHFLSTK